MNVPELKSRIAKSCGGCGSPELKAWSDIYSAYLSARATPERQLSEDADISAAAEKCLPKYQRLYSLDKALYGKLIKAAQSCIVHTLSLSRVMELISGAGCRFSSAYEIVRYAKCLADAKYIDTATLNEAISETLGGKEA